MAINNHRRGQNKIRILTINSNKSFNTINSKNSKNQADKTNKTFIYSNNLIQI